MATRSNRDPLDWLDRPIAVDFGVVLGVVALLTLVSTHLGTYLFDVGNSIEVLYPPLPALLPLLGTVAVVTLLVGTYAHVRDLPAGLELPRRAQRSVVAVAALAPAAVVALTKATGAVTGVTLAEIVLTSYGPEPDLVVLLAFGVVEPLLASVAFALVCQVLFQETFGRTLDRTRAAPLAAVAAAFLLVSNASGLTLYPDRGTLVVAGLFAALLGLAAFANERVERDWLRALAALPATVIVALAVFETVASVETLAGALFLAGVLGTLGLAAYGYQRTNSLAVPVLAYASFQIAISVVIIALEAGVQ